MYVTFHVDCTLFRNTLFVQIKPILSFEHRAREKYQQIMKATQRERERPKKSEALKKSTIPPSKGIEEGSSEWDEN